MSPRPLPASSPTNVEEKKGARNESEERGKKVRERERSDRTPVIVLCLKPCYINAKNMLQGPEPCAVQWGGEYERNRSVRKREKASGTGSEY